MTHHLYSGAGPGAQAADGCSVELYRRLEYLDDLAPVEQFLRTGTTVLELGCGAGRLTRRLLALGCQPTAVDNSADMLAALPEDVPAIHSTIERLHLEQRFGAVLLASCLINHVDPHVRTLFLQAARRHLNPGGLLLLQRHDPTWLRTVSSGWSAKSGGAEVSVLAVARSETEVNMTLQYSLGGSNWTHTFAATPLEEPELEAMLSDSGFTGPKWLGPGRRWVASAV